MHRFLLHNDEIRDTGDRIVSPGQVGLLNGWGVFSTIRVYDGVLFAWDRHFARMQRDALRLRVPFPASSEFAGVKYLSWSENLTWNERAHEQGFDEVILLNERGEIAELTSANIFVVHGDRVSTPPLSSGCLPGITRATLLDIAQIDERTLFPADLESADEVFITSTTRELMPVSEVEG